MSAITSVAIDSDGIEVRTPEETIQVYADALERAGWEFRPECNEDHCNNGDCPPCDDDHLDTTEGDPREILARWHDETHEGAFRFYGESPCREMGRLYGVRHG